MVRAIAHILQHDWGKSTLSFLTLTIPPLSREEHETIAREWGKLIGRLLQFIQRRLQRVGLPTHIVSVSELQSKRARSGDLGALHCHVLFVGRHRHGSWVFRPQELRFWWLAAISRLINRDLPEYPCENIQRVQKDAGRYLSKYMSKGFSSCEGIDPSLLPSQWWNRTASAIAAVQARTIKSRNLAEWLLALIAASNGNEDEFTAYPIWDEWEGGFVLRGWAGWLKKNLLEDTQKAFSPLKLH